MSSTQPARGTRDFLPADIRRREFVINVVRRVYERYGFEPLETPAFENIETLVGRYGEEGGKLIFKILKRGEHEASGHADLALRYDLTVPLARVVAQYQNELPKYFKRYQIQPVWRAERPARGRFREFCQCDIDAMGSTSPVLEVEVIGAVSEVLTELGFADFTINLNHRQILSALLKSASVPSESHGSVLVALDKEDKIGRDAVWKELGEIGIDDGARTRIFGWMEAAFKPDWVDHIGRYFTQQDDQDRAAFANVQEILALSERTAAAGKLRFQPSLARGLSYYTGAIMEIAVPDLPGSLGGGGRYDRLIGMFLGRDIPACGVSLGLERIVVVMAEREMFPPSVSAAPADVMVAMWSEASRAHALALARELRAGGLSVDIYPDAEKPGKQFKYASARGYRLVALAGDDEQRNGTVTMKNMATTAQSTVPRERMVGHIVAELQVNPETESKVE